MGLWGMCKDVQDVKGCMGLNEDKQRCIGMYRDAGECMGLVGICKGIWGCTKMGIVNGCMGLL